MMYQAQTQKELNFGKYVLSALPLIIPFSQTHIHTHAHTLSQDPRAAFTVSSKDFKGLDDGRVSFVGDIKKVPDAEVARVRELYLKKHPGHFWVDFGDFDFFRMEEMKVGG